MHHPPTEPAETAAPAAATVASGRRALLLVNRNSRQGAETAEHALAALRAGGVDVREAETDDLADALAAIRDHRAGVTEIVVGGGDGTLNRVARELVQAGLPVGILPLGTANDLARTLGLPPAVEAACDVIARGHRVDIDVGYVNDRPFFNAANIGAGVAVTRRLSRQGKRRWGVLGYGLAALEAIRDVRPFEAEIAVDGRAHHVRTIQIAVGNGPHQGGAFTVADDATLDDGLLHAYSLRPMRLWQLGAMIPALRAGRQREQERADTFCGAELEIRTRRPMDVIADGEPVARTPARFRVARRALSVFAPEPGEAARAAR